MGTAVDARCPFATKEFPIGRINLALEAFSEVLQILLVVSNSILDPEIAMVSDVLQCSSDLKIFISIHVCHPKRFLGTDAQFARGWHDRQRNIIYPLQAQRQVAQIIDRNEYILESLKGFGANHSLAFPAPTTEGPLGS